MSRAFVNEQEGWSFCKAYMRDCMMAKPDGSCTLRKCKFGLDKKKDVPKAAEGK